VKVVRTLRNLGDTYIRVHTDSENQGNLEKKSMSGKIREFESLGKIRELKKNVDD
jgi:hypothetical protein